MLLALIGAVLLSVAIADGITQEEIVGQEFGLFIHYGITTYTYPNNIQGNYPSIVFAPTDFDPNQWTSAAKDAGMTYLIYTAKHVFGWCGWDSSYTDYDIATSSIPQLDTVRAIADACAAAGLKLSLYYSLWDVRHYYIDGNNCNLQYTQFVKNQLTELLTNYGEIYSLWLDCANLVTEDQCVEWKSHIKSLQPNCNVLFNLNKSISDFVVLEATDPPEFNNILAECDFNAYNVNRWWAHTDLDGPFWRPMAAVNKKIICNSRNANCVINIPPGPSGKISLDGIKFLQDVGKLLKGVIDDPGDRISYTGSWTLNSGESASGAYQRTLHFSHTPGDYFEHNFYGSSIKLVSNIGPDCGILDIYLDGQYMTSFDSYSPIWRSQITAFENYKLDSGDHTLKAIIRGDKNIASADYYCYLDYIGVNLEDIDSTRVKLDDFNPRILYIGDWLYNFTTHEYNYGFYNDTLHLSKTAGDCLELQFNGKVIQLGTRVGPNCGKFDIFLDDEYQTTIDTYALTTTDQIIVYNKRSLSDKKHYLRLMVRGDKNPKSSDFWCHLDYIRLDDCSAQQIITILLND